MRILYIVLILVITTIPISAQNLDSSNYTLLAPSMDSSSGIVDSTNYSAIANSSPVDSFSSTSSNYRINGGTATFLESYVPTITCFETSTTISTTNCVGIPGNNGMQGVCSSPGCYNRAKLEINTQNNPEDVKYALQISTTSDFSTNVQYIAGSNRIPKSNLTSNDFLYKCEWEGTINGSYCVSANTTYQKFNILGLTPNTLYYIRASAFKGINSDGIFSQSEWGPAVTATTNNTSISFDIDIAENTSTETSPPYRLNINNIIPDSIFTSNNYLIFNITSNALNGTKTFIKTESNNLIHTNNIDTIPSYSGDLSLTSNGFGIRNVSATNQQTNSGYLGDIIVSPLPTDFTDSGAPNKVGGPTTSYTELFNSNSLPILNGISGYSFKAKVDFSRAAGIYNGTLTVSPYGIY